MNRLLRVLIILGVLGLVSVAVFLYFGGQGGSVSMPFLGEPPVVIITRPTSAVSVYSGNGVAIRAAATSASGIARIDLLVNGETKDSIPADDPTQTSFSPSFLWFSSRVGQQTLSVVAFDADGRASQLASIHVNVFALEAAQVDGAISNDPAALAAAAGDGGAAGEPGGDGVLGGDPGAEPADQGGAAGQPEQPAAEPAGPEPLADNPPSIIFFDYDLDLIADGARINWFISAEDDLGLDRIDFKSFLDGAVVFDLEFVCGGELLCEFNLPGAISPGESLFSVQAVDVSGQTSEAELLFAELVGEPGQPPAAAEHDGGLALPGPDLVVDLNWPFGDLGFGVEDIFGQAAPPVDPDPVVSEGDCATLTAQPNGEAFTMTATITCDLQADEGFFLLPELRSDILHQGFFGGRGDTEWRDQDRTSIRAGETFSEDFNRLFCGVSYETMFRVSNYTGAGQVGENVASVTHTFETPACPAGSTDDIDLTLEALPQGAYKLSWEIQPNGEWPEIFIDAGVVLQLVRYQEDGDDFQVIETFLLSRDRLLAGETFNEVDDQVQCGTPYAYTVRMFAADEERIDFADWLLRRSVADSGLDCPGGNLNLAGIELSVVNTFPNRVLVEAQFPGDYPWPAGDRVSLHIEDRWGEGPFGLDQIIGIGDQVRGGQPFVLERGASVVCGSEDWSFRLALYVGGEAGAVEIGSIASITTLPCSPVGPRSISVNGTSDNGCPGNIRYCVIVSWAPYQAPLSPELEYAGEYLVLKRIDRFGIETTVRLDLNETQYIDLQPTHIAAGDHCVPPERYGIAVYDNQGHASAFNFVIMPDLNCINPWNFHIEHSN